MTKTKIRRLLIVEDDQDILELLTQVFEQENFEVFVATSGENALEWLQINNAHIVISDIFMPNGTGIWLVEKLRNEGNNIPVFLITAGNDYTQSQVIELGANGLFNKPFNIEILEAALEEIFI